MKPLRAGPVRLVVLGLAVVAYCLAAWAVAPGFYDGFAPGQPYHWISPPPQEAPSNAKPQGAQGSVQGDKAGSVTTTDGQAQIYSNPGAFPAGQSITISLQPVSSYPPIGDFTVSSNVYLVTASAVPAMPLNLVLAFSLQVFPAPSTIYRAPQSGGSWTKAGATQVVSTGYIRVGTTELGYFVAGAPKTASSGGGSGGGGSTALPVIAAGAILLVILAGIPLVVTRRRSAAARRRPRPRPRPRPRDDDEPPTEANRGGARRRQKKRLR